MATVAILLDRVAFAGLGTAPSVTPGRLFGRGLAAASALGIAALALAPPPASDASLGPGWAALLSAFVLSSAATHAIARRGAAWRGGMPQRLALVGDPGHFAAIEQSLRETADPRREIALRLRHGPGDSVAPLCRLALRRGIDTVVLVMPDQSAASIRAACLALADAPFGICLAEGPAARGPGLPWVPGLPWIEVFPPQPRGLQPALKRGLDLACAGLALLLLAPALLGIALAIRLDSPGPALVRHWRTGLGGQPVPLHRFRTTADARGAAADLPPTRVGRLLRLTSLDRLPQLWNLLCGDLSLVGPQPHAVAMRVGDRRYTDVVPLYPMRHRVRPGITGWAQVNGLHGPVETQRQAERRIGHDLWYIRHWSIALDLQILLRTALGGFAGFKAG